MEIKTNAANATIAACVSACISVLAACGGGDSSGAASNPSTAPGGNVTTNSNPATTPVAASRSDITAAILANSNVILNGDSIVNLPAGTTTYSGVISGTGTLAIGVAGAAGTLILTGDSTFTLPAAQQTETATQTKSPTDPNHVHYWVIRNPNPPAVIVNAGATLQLGTPSSASGSIGSYIPNTAGTTINLDNFQIDGTLVLESGPTLHMGILSGAGVIQRPPVGATGGTVFFVGENSFSGVYSQLFGGYFGSDHVIFSMPKATIFSNESFITAAPQGLFDDTAGSVLKYPQTIWESHYGDDINTDAGHVIFTGIYSYSNSGDQLKPSLSDPSLNTMLVRNGRGSLTGGNNSSFRGINIEGGTTQWGDGSSNKFFLPSAPSPAASDSSVKNAYINLHNGSTLVFDYNGKYACNISITGGGGGPDADGSAGTGNLTIAGTPGNYAVLTMPQNYNGITAIGAGATLQLGNGSAVTATEATIGAPTTAEPFGAITSKTTIATYTGDSSLLTAGSSNGNAADAIVNNGALVVANTSAAISLSNISGPGSLLQAGTASTTLLGNNTFSGGTTITSGALTVASDTALGTGNVANSSSLATAGGQHLVKVGGAYSQTANAALTLAIGTSPDQLQVAGQAALSGTLVLNFSGTPARGTKFVVVSAAGGIAGTFNAITSNGASVVGNKDATTYYVVVQ
ncbi:MAG: autotransporter [Collimonas sp.]|uniref:autotransporter n=1 Tax=Collimonas sp. TaxID=1963772 RepID=UPI003267908C